MRTARRAAPLLPENNDGSSYLYISLLATLPLTLCHPIAPVRAQRCARYTPQSHSLQTRVLPLLSLRRVKRLTHILHELQARLYPKNDRHEAGTEVFAPCAVARSRSVTAPKDALLT